MDLPEVRAMSAGATNCPRSQKQGTVSTAGVVAMQPEGAAVEAPRSDPELTPLQPAEHEGMCECSAFRGLGNPFWLVVHPFVGAA
jgi:hypothetical protein